MFKPFALVAGIACLSMGLWACPGTLEDPSIFGDGGTSGDGGGKACNAEVDILQKRCGESCHSTAAATATHPDLQKSGIYARLKDVKSSCNNLPYIDSASPEKSFVLNKVSASKPTCGEQMPRGMTPLTADEIACLTSWIKAGGK